MISHLVRLGESSKISSLGSSYFTWLKKIIRDLEIEDVPSSIRQALMREAQPRWFRFGLCSSSSCFSMVVKNALLLAFGSWLRRAS